MTKEEAIKVLNKMKYPYNCKARKLIISNVERDNEAINMAIQALSQEPCDDAVSRKLAICAIKNLYPDIPRVDFNGAKRKWADKYAQYIECERLIEQLPSVTQKSEKCGACMKGGRTLDEFIEDSKESEEV